MLGCFRKRCLGTFSNYLGHVRGAGHALGLEAPPVGHQAIRRAMSGIAKRQLYEARPKLFLKKSARRFCNTAFASGIVHAGQDCRGQYGLGGPTRLGGPGVCDALASILFVPIEVAL